METRHTYIANTPVAFWRRRCPRPQWKLTSRKAMAAKAVRHMLILVASVNFLVLSTMRARAAAPAMPNTVQRTPQRPAKPCQVSRTTDVISSLIHLLC